MLIILYTFGNAFTRSNWNCQSAITRILQKLITRSVINCIYKLEYMAWGKIIDKTCHIQSVWKSKHYCSERVDLGSSYHERSTTMCRRKEGARLVLVNKVYYSLPGQFRSRRLANDTTNLSFTKPLYWLMQQIFWWWRKIIIYLKWRYWGGFWALFATMINGEDFLTMNCT